MKRMKLWSARIDSVWCSACILVLSGCTTYVEQAPVAPAYVPPPPLPPPGPATVVVAPPPAPGATVVSIRAESDFYEPLNPYGEWVTVAGYGRCWRPVGVSVTWRPYCDGYWQRTDAGWFWVTAEPWGWATYHYGRWDWTANFGWIWVPQTQWAPSWVAWREGAGYIGWAPLPPTATISVSGGVLFRDASYAPRAFVFVEERHLLEPVRPTTVIVNNTTVINKTVNITKIQVVNKTVVNEGPRPDVVERATGRKIQTVQVRDLRSKEEAPVLSRRQTRPANAPAAAERKAQPAPRLEIQSTTTVTARTGPRVNATPQVTEPANAPADVDRRLQSPARTEPPPAAKVMVRSERRVERTVPAATPASTPAARSEVRNVQTATPTTPPARVAAEKPARPEQVRPPSAPVRAERVQAAERTAASPAEPRAVQQLKSPKEHGAGQESGNVAGEKASTKRGERLETQPQRGAANRLQ